MVTYVFDPGDVITASELNTNNTDLENRLTGLTNEDLSDDAGIASEQMADRHGWFSVTVDLATRFASTGAVVNHTLPDNATSPGSEIDRFYLALPSGKLAYMMAIEVYIIALAQGAAAEKPTWWVTYNGNVLGSGNPTNVAAAGRFTFRNGNGKPIAAVADGGYVSVGVGRTTAGANAPTWSGAKMRIWFKNEHSSD